MANICDEIVTIVAATPSDMAYVLKLMANNVINGPNGTRSFNERDIEAAGDDVFALWSLLDRANGMNKLCLFSTEPDTRAEYGSVWCPYEINDKLVLIVEMGLKWSGSHQPAEFCADLDSLRFGWCVSDSGEWCEWSDVSYETKTELSFIDGASVPGAVRYAASAAHRVRSLEKIARHVNISRIDADMYREMSDYE